MSTPAHPSFRDLAVDLTTYRRPDEQTARDLDEVRAAFKDLADRVGQFVPDGPDGTIAARKVHDACQACIFAIVRDQPSNA